MEQERLLRSTDNSKRDESDVQCQSYPETILWELPEGQIPSDVIVIRLASLASLVM